MKKMVIFGLIDGEMVELTDEVMLTVLHGIKKKIRETELMEVERKNLFKSVDIITSYLFDTVVRDN